MLVISEEVVLNEMFNKPFDYRSEDFFDDNKQAHHFDIATDKKPLPYS